MEYNVIAGIVTYNPKLDRLKENIYAIHGQVRKTVIVDNGSGNIESIRNLILNDGLENVIILSNEMNLGIAAALNQVMKYAEDKSYEWVITLDQDSVCMPDLLETMFPDVTEKTAIIAPIINDINKIKHKEICDVCHEVNRCITSGSLTRVSAWRHVQGFDEKMFIDAVDFDFCDRLRAAGYVIMQTSKTQLIHEIGHISTKRFLFWDVVVNNHSAFRKYYIAKNIIYLDRKNNGGKITIRTVLRTIKLLLITLLYEDDKMNKTRRIFEGVARGLKEEI